MSEGNGLFEVESAYYRKKELYPVAFGTSGHRGSSLNGTFNRLHVQAITQAVVDFRRYKCVTGPLFLACDTHMLSYLAWETALEVLAGNHIDVRVESDALGVTATPLVSRAILAHNQLSSNILADGLIITPSHNPPEDGGIKYNPIHGGAAEPEITNWIEKRANELLVDTSGILSVATDRARCWAVPYDYVADYLKSLNRVLNLAAIRSSGLKLAVDPLGGAGLPVWLRLESETGISVHLLNDELDPEFSFLPADHDGRVRMDCSNPETMAGVVASARGFDLTFANDPDADRHGIIDQSGLVNPNHFLAVCVDYLIRYRGEWSEALAFGKTLVTSSMIDRIVGHHGRTLYETPVGLKWFVQGLHQGWIGFGGEESAGATLLTRDGSPWSTDKDGIVMCLLAAEIMAVTGLSPSEYYQVLTVQHGRPLYQRVDTPMTDQQKADFKRLDETFVTSGILAGDQIVQIQTKAPGNGVSIGGIKVVTENGWFAARPSGTEPIYKIYAESFKSEQHLSVLIEEAKLLISTMKA